MQLIVDGINLTDRMIDDKNATLDIFLKLYF